MKEESHDEGLSPAQALASYRDGNPCGIVKERTEYVALYNKSRWSIEVAFLQASSIYRLPGYTTDTGVYQACKNHPKRRTCKSDPCEAGESRMPILATSIRCSVLFRKDGETKAIDLEWSSGDHKYLVRGGWVIRNRHLEKNSNLFAFLSVTKNPREVVTK